MGATRMKIVPEIITVLEGCDIKDNIVYLPQIQLERKTYVAVNKCLESIGGKWNRKAKGHVFGEDPTDAFDNMLSTGETTDFKKEFQFFETPPELAQRMVEMAELVNGDYVREPSAGKGSIIRAIKKYEKENDLAFGYMVCEKAEANWKYLVAEYRDEINMDIFWDDFLQQTSRSANKIIQNPPFSKQRDVDHILHAYSLLNTKGVLVSIVSEGPFFRENKKSVAFRKFLEEVGAEVVKLPKGTFKSSGTMVNTRLVKIKKS